MARWGGAHLGDGFYAEPDWWPEYLRLEREEADGDTAGIDSRELWRHVIEHWRGYVLPDLARFYPGLPVDEQELLATPWRSLREYVLALFGIRDSVTGSTFARLHQKDGDT
ncbi:hypothetical protein G7068_12010 [Leucobacter viscericola]|uniref:Uncharacterized protein n=1 Tax=Leucobacter viscericola TaxID=2714935 RepID=A0A6G7XGV2_9MICO|nr:hypothetical protein [Leucobacter viscericola]QIK63834.1 hypothetical protein G7068_12010 [Leucobacter viscericola]